MRDRYSYLVYVLFVCLISDGALGGPPRGRLVDILHAIQNTTHESCPGVFGHLEQDFGGLESIAPRPLKELKTKRFTLRPLRPDEAGAVEKILCNPKVAEMSGDYLDLHTIQYLLHTGSQTIPTDHPASMINFGIFDGEKLIGMSQLAVTPPHYSAYEKGYAKPNELWFEVSYHLDPAYWGDHVAGEVTRVTTAFAFEHYGAHGIHGQTIPSNEKSGNVLRYSLKMDLVHSDSSGNHYAKRRDGLPIEPPAPVAVSSPSGGSFEPAHGGGFEPFFEPFYPPRHGGGPEPFLEPGQDDVLEPFLEPYREPAAKPAPKDERGLE